MSKCKACSESPCLIVITIFLFNYSSGSSICPSTMYAPLLRTQPFDLLELVDWPQNKILQECSKPTSWEMKHGNVFDLKFGSFEYSLSAIIRAGLEDCWRYSLNYLVPLCLIARLRRNRFCSLYKKSCLFWREGSLFLKKCYNLIHFCLPSSKSTWWFHGLSY